MLSEPKLTPSVIASLPDLLKDFLSETTENRMNLKRKSILVSSNALCNRFIFTRWGIRSSQRRRNKNLFSAVRKACRVYFNHLLNQGRITCEKGMMRFDFGVYKFDEIRGNLILAFAVLDDNPFS